MRADKDGEGLSRVGMFEQYAAILKALKIAYLVLDLSQLFVIYRHLEAEFDFSWLES